jgi:dihydrodiol dehydrogenase / D-xylose 1-dehydrogenase (NADP)
MANQKTKWGILGTGWIASQFARDLAYAADAELVAVGSRTKESANKFAEEFAVPRAWGSYEELANDSGVDAIYVATPHPAHRENVMTCLRAGKAVLCEKPFTVNSKETEEMIACARENNVFLMEAMWTRFLPAIRQVRQWLSEQRIGEVRLVEADFGFRADINPEGRLFNLHLGGGSLLDAGIYPVSFASMILGARPAKILSTAHIGETGVDEQFTAIFEYESGSAASLSGAIRLGLTNEAFIFGTKGHIHIPSFLAAKSASLYVNGQDAETFTDDRESLGYAFETEEVGRCLRAGLKESEIMPLEESLQIMQLMDDMREQWGLRYPSEM